MRISRGGLGAGAAFALTAALAAALASGAGATSTGPQPGVSGVPAGGGFAAEMNCTSCHQSYTLNPDDRGTVELRGLPERYAEIGHQAGHKVLG